MKERLTLTLTLMLQAVDPKSVTHAIYIAFRIGKGHSAAWRSRKKQVTSLLPDRASSTSACSVHCGQTERVETGHYDLSPEGRRELAAWSDAFTVSSGHA